MILGLLCGADTDSWQTSEQAYLKNITQLTSEFVRAGEGYFSPDAKNIIFQAEEKESGNPFYQIFTMDLANKKSVRVSPGIGKTTCSYFSPDGKKILFASSHLDPKSKEYYGEEYKLRDEEKKAGKRRTYKWDFDPAMEIFEANPDGSGMKRLTDSPGYDAEASYSPDGKSIVFCSNRSGAENLELYIMDSEGKNVRKLTNAPGCYNGGPFFSPDGKRIIFRTDRKKKDNLQIHVIDVDGKNDRTLAENLAWVQWCPFWYTDSKHILFAAADHSTMMRPNYDLYWMNVDSGKQQRITFAPGADILPVFTKDGKKMMWTSTRDGRSPAQLYIADFTPPQNP
ncbi:MAG: PD40 domain-containing protein [Gemmataceae bacterium]|nr:PD40 domain-containing protein [Gemmataceae bacterium]